MKTIDRILQKWRFRKALQYIPADNTTMLDIGCADALLHRFLKPGDRYVGIDASTKLRKSEDNIQFIRGVFPKDFPNDIGKFNCVAMLAVLEHIPEDDHDKAAQQCFEVLEPGGRLIITVPEPLVDNILYVLHWLHLIDAHDMALAEHHAFDPGSVPQIFTAAGFRLLCHSRFQLGLNNLFVFERPVLK